jgi:hypothetical protein
MAYLLRKISWSHGWNPAGTGWNRLEPAGTGWNKKNLGYVRLVL